MANTLSPPRVAPYWPTPTLVTERRFTVQGDAETALVAVGMDARRNGITLFPFDGSPANFLTGRGNNRIHGRIDLVPAPAGKTMVQLRIRPLGRVLGSEVNTTGRAEQYHLVCWQMRIIAEAAALDLTPAQRRAAQLSMLHAAQPSATLPFPFDCTAAAPAVGQQAVLDSEVTADRLVEAFREHAAMLGITTMPTEAPSELAWMVGDGKKRVVGTFQALPMTVGARIWLTWNGHDSAAGAADPGSDRGRNAPAPAEEMQQFVKKLVSHVKLLSAPMDGFSL